MGGHDDRLLLGRAHEQTMLDDLLAEARGGHGAVLVIRGEAGVGKTSLLRHCADHATGLQLRRIAGVQSEMQLPFASLHQLCRPFLDRVGSIPAPQEVALSVALGLIDGETPDPFLVSLAALSLLSEAAAQQPMLCLIDDAQWVDSASTQALAFVARRLLGDSIAMVFAVREPASNRGLDGLPELRLEGLAEDDAHALLRTVIPGRLESRVRDRLLTETRGNPLALLELPQRLTSTQLPGAFVLRDDRGLPERIEDAFLARLEGLSREARLLLLLAAAEPGDDPLLLWRAADRLGIDASAADATEGEGLLTVDSGVRFRHPLVRSAVYRAASPHHRRAVHLALAESIDPRAEPDRRAWHLAAATVGPDETVAMELERSAGRARARGGLSAAAAFLKRSAELTSDSTARAERALAAAQASLHAGEFESALHVLHTADESTFDELHHARADLMRAQIASASGSLDEAPALLLAAAERLEPLDRVLARESYLDAWGAALFAGDRAGADMREVSRVVRSRRAFGVDQHGTDLLLHGMSVLMTDGREAAAPILRRALSEFLAEDLPIDRGMQWSVIASCAALELWDFETRNRSTTRQLQLAREAGALTPLAFGLNGSAITMAMTGEFEAALRLCAEAAAVNQAIGSRVPPFGGMLLAALRGRDSEGFALLEEARRNAGASGSGFGLQWAQWTGAMFLNGLRRYDEALDAAERAWDAWPDWFVSIFASAEHIEAAARLGQPHRAAESLERVTASASVGATEWAVGISERSTALLSEVADAEPHYVKAIQCLSATRLRPEVARTHLVYGEWLRREGRRVDAREQLRTAHSMFTDMGAEGFAERARHELVATGATVRKRSQAQHEELTPQEAHVARLAADGRTNAEIGATLYLSPRTVEWHLKKVFLKLQINSRRALRTSLPTYEPVAG
ncbi:AAA family ATPase [Agromyces sp. NPDC049794]|uniref:ATP-binding protein n=1 Tax=unclassified Agromyces TaxID=2639701 RepID=UPI0033F266C2